MGDNEPNFKMKVMLMQQRNLSDDVIIQEILTRLPINSILRFESVSKHWHSTLSSSDFANAHFMKSPFSHPFAPVNTLFIRSERNFYLFSYDEDQVSSNNLEDNLVELNVDFGIENEYLELTGCCNGLICLTITSNEYFILWNPATGKMHKYESDGYLKVRYMQEPSVSHGFGYASLTDDYKYVRIVTQLRGNETGNIVHIFSLREKQWRKIDFDYGDVIVPYDQAVLFNEKLYWLAFSTEGGSIITGNILVSFDLAVERFDIFKFGSYHMNILGAMGDCLSVCHWDYTHTVQDNYDVSLIMHILKSDMIVKSFRVPKSLYLDSCSQLTGCTKTGKVFLTGPSSFDNGVRNPWRRTVHLVDTSTKPIRWTALLRFDEPMIKIVRYVPSLVSPFPILESV